MAMAREFAKFKIYFEKVRNFKILTLGF
jgi:hypothetical protein